MADFCWELRRQWGILGRHIRHLGPSGRQRKLDTLAELFRVVNAFLRDVDANYWLVYGTLLGHFREGRILAHDRDLDFGLHELEFQKVWQARRQLPPGFEMHDTSHNHRGPKLFISYRAWEADLYFYEDRDGMLASYEYSRNQGDMAPFPREWVLPTVASSFLDCKTRIPADSEAYLRHTYGYIEADAVRDPQTGYWSKST